MSLLSGSAVALISVEAQVVDAPLAQRTAGAASEAAPAQLPGERVVAVEHAGRAPAACEQLECKGRLQGDMIGENGGKVVGTAKVDAARAK